MAIGHPPTLLITMKTMKPDTITLNAERQWSVAAILFSGTLTVRTLKFVLANPFVLSDQSYGFVLFKHDLILTVQSSAFPLEQL